MTRNPKSLLRQFSLTLTICLMFGTSANASPILDQFQNGTGGAGGFYNTFERAQTFTAGATGLLSQIDVATFSVNSGVDLRIYNTTLGLPEDTELAGKVFSIGDLAVGTTSFDISDLGIFVNFGDVLAFGIRTTSAAFVDWQGNSNGGYSGGSMYQRGVSATPFLPTNWQGGNVSGWDLKFATYVDGDVTPVPAPLPLLTFLLGGLALITLRRK